MSSPPVLTPLKKAEQIQSLKHALLVLESLPTSTPCAACVEFSAGFCSSYNATVPPEFQAQGCENFGEVPF